MEKIFRQKDPFVLTIYGATGHLASYKIFPALYKLAEQKRLPKDYAIFGFTRSNMTRKSFQNMVTKSIQKAYKKDVNTKALSSLLSHVYVHIGKYKDQEAYASLNATIKKLFPQRSITTIHYFAVPPIAVHDIVKNIGLHKYSSNTRLILEKPFGVDADSAEKLFHFIGTYFKEKDIFLLDHYLGKSSVQSILHMRHSNKLLNLLLRGREIANVQITAMEQEGIGSRAGYFENMGTLKDMIQSHLLQIFALSTMSIPIRKSESAIHREKSALLSALQFTKSEKNIVLGQYASYTQEKGVDKKSKTETFVALKLELNRENWENTPIYIRTGKNTCEKHTYIVIELKKFPHQDTTDEPNRIIIEFQPEEKVHITLTNRFNSFETSSFPIMTSSSIACSGDSCLPEHGHLLLDVLQGKKEFFVSLPEIIACWRLIDCIQKTVHQKQIKVQKYKDQSRGPKKQNDITKQDNFTWFDIHHICD